MGAKESRVFEGRRIPFLECVCMITKKHGGTTYDLKYRAYFKAGGDIGTGDGAAWIRVGQGPPTQPVPRGHQVSCKRNAK